jgi:hypothetical protein
LLVLADGYPVLSIPGSHEWSVDFPEIKLSDKIAEGGFGEVGFVVVFFLCRRAKRCGTNEISVRSFLGLQGFVPRQSGCSEDGEDACDPQGPQVCSQLYDRDLHLEVRFLEPQHRMRSVLTLLLTIL